MCSLVLDSGEGEHRCATCFCSHLLSPGAAVQTRSLKMLVHPRAPTINPVQRTHIQKSLHFIGTICQASFFSGLFCFESQNAPISKFPRQTEGTDINECARLSGSNRPPFQHVSFKGMTHAQFAISKILLFVSTVITLPNRKCNAAPPEDKSNWWFLGRLLTALVFVGHVEQCCL